MMVPVNTPLLQGNELSYVEDCIKSGWISSEGEYVKKFESSLAAYVDRKFGIAVSNGSAALDIAVKVLDIGKGDEVIIPTFSIISPALSVVRQGAKPVLVDCDVDSFNTCASLIEDKINSNTKAIIIVHTYNFPVDLNPILKLAKKHSIKVIEDAAEMIGQSYNNRKCGSFGDISTFSFYANKHITTGEGGMLMTNDQALADKCKELRNLCFQPHKRFVHEDIGWNYRMTNLQAALGLAQLERIEYSIQRKKEIGNTYFRSLRDISSIDLPKECLPYAENIYWVYPLMIKKGFSDTAEEVMAKLNAKGVGTRPFFYPIHKQPVFKKMGLFKDENYPESEAMYACGFYIPSGLGLKEGDQEFVSDVLHQVLA